MHKIDTPDAVAGMYDNGDPLVPRLATYPDAAHMNALQMEICNAVTGAGLALSKPDMTQLAQAIAAYILAAMNAHLSAANPHGQYVRNDAAQGLTSAQQSQARDNIAAPSRAFAYLSGQC